MSKDKKEDISKPVLAKPRSFLELLGISFPEKKDAPTQKEKLGELLKEDNEEFFIAQIEEYLKKKDSCTSDKN